MPVSACRSYCEHGGICELEAGHDGLHDSRYCQWDDDHALTEEEADAVAARSTYGADYLRLKAVVGRFMPEEPL